MEPVATLEHSYVAINVDKDFQGENGRDAQVVSDIANGLHPLRPARLWRYVALAPVIRFSASGHVGLEFHPVDLSRHRLRLRRLNGTLLPQDCCDAKAGILIARLLAWA